MSMAADPILRVRNLSIDIVSTRHRLVDNVSFEVGRNEVLGVVGESGSGKSITMLAVLGLLPPALRVAGGEIWLNGREIGRLSFREMRGIRGKEISLIFQDPMTALNPVLRVGPQIGEAVRLHNRTLSSAQVRKRVVALLELVGIPDPERRYGQYPNEFSGGMRQRAVIAIAMANEPDLLIADEPTTALDVTIQAQVMRVLAEIRERTRAAMVLITHDLGLVAEAADRIAVLYSGRVVETAAADTIFGETCHPYTAGLIASLPRMDEDLAKLYSIPGFVPEVARRPSGCAFHPRCGLSQEREPCRVAPPPLRPVAAEHLSACHFSAETPAWAAAQERERHTAAATATVAARQERDVVVRIEQVSKVFHVARSSGWGRDRLQALSDVSFEIRRGRTLGLVGESGCGKSTLSKVILQLERPSAGAVRLKSENLVGMSGSRLREQREHLQVVFQDPYSSLDPRFTIHDIIAEPLRIHGRYEPARVTELLAHVGLGAEAEARRPGDFSGGQRQRIAIARALALQPDVLILDEAVSALDVSIQAQVINLLKNLQEEFHLTYLFISHDLSVVRHMSDDVAVMYLGRLIEIGSRQQIFSRPAHPYTQALLSAIPRAGARARDPSGRIVLKGELPNPLSPPSGCRFRTRCFKAAEICARLDPELLERTEAGHRSACHFAGPAAAIAVPA
jgi:peptide/nickel transport system ATP-binding protein